MDCCGLTLWDDDILSGLVYYAHSGYLCSLELWKNTKLNNNDNRSVAITLIWENILSKDTNLSSRLLFVLIPGYMWWTLYIYIIISHPQAWAYWAWVMIEPWHHVQVFQLFSNAPSRNFVQLWGAGGSKVSRPPLAPTSNASCERTRNSNILKLKIAWNIYIYKHE